MREKINVRRVLVQKPEGKRPLARPECRDENIKIHFTEIQWDFSNGFIWRTGSGREQ
jgi:hypothetical protein